MSNFFQSTNPALRNEQAFNPFAYEQAGVATLPATTAVSGVIQKTTLLVTLAMIFGGLGYWLFSQNPSALWIGSIVALVVTLGIYFVIYGKPQLSPVLAPLYAIVQGTFLGGLTAVAEAMLVSRFGSSVPGGVALQALLITGCVLASMLLLYKFQIVRPTKMFVSVVSTATLGIMLTYLVGFVLSFFGINLPFVSLGSVFSTGTAGLIGLGINLLILGLAACWLVIDFGMVEEQVAAGAPKYMEWYCAFALMVTLAWIYWEAVKLVLRLAALFGRRD